MLLQQQSGRAIARSGFLRRSQQYMAMHPVANGSFSCLENLYMSVCRSHPLHQSNICGPSPFLCVCCCKSNASKVTCSCGAELDRTQKMILSPFRKDRTIWREFSHHCSWTSSTCQRSCNILVLILMLIKCLVAN